MDHVIGNLLSTVNVSVDAIQNFSSAAMQYGDRPDELVELWRREFSRRAESGGDLLSLLYCLNDLLQKSKRNPRVEAPLTRAFSGVVESALSQALARTPEIRRDILRMMTVWKERRVFAPKLISKWVESLRFSDVLVVSDDEGSDEEDEDDVRVDRDAAPSRTSDAKTTPKTPQEELKLALEEMPLSKILSLAAWTNRQVSSARTVLQAAEGVASGDFAKFVSAHEDETKMSGLSGQDVAQANRQAGLALARLTTTRQALFAHSVVRDHLARVLADRVTEIETKLSKAASALEETSLLERVLRQCLEPKLDPSNSEGERGLRGEYSTIRRVPKRLKLSSTEDLGEAAPKRDRDAELEQKNPRAMVYHKGLRKYVPLPEAGEEEEWR